MTLTQRKIFLSVQSTDNFPEWKLALSRRFVTYTEVKTVDAIDIHLITSYGGRARGTKQKLVLINHFLK
jgi:hypothetical protein